MNVFRRRFEPALLADKFARTRRIQRSLEGLRSHRDARCGREGPPAQQQLERRTKAVVHQACHERVYDT